MKKLNKLTLNQETLRKLTEAELEKVAGAIVTFPCGTHSCQASRCFGTCPI